MNFLRFFIALMASTAFGSGFPDYPTENLPTIHVLPAEGSLILDVRSTYLSGDPATTDRDVEIGVFQLAKQSESVWQLQPGLKLPPRVFGCTPCTSASWASTTRQLLLTLPDNAYLVDSSGNFKALGLTMPGVSVSYASSDAYAISADGQLLAFRVYTRDRGDNAPDATDPYWQPNAGRLYNDLVYERVEGSTPITISKVVEYAPPAWSPDHKRIAYSKRVEKGDQQLELLIADVTNNGTALQPTVISAPHHSTLYSAAAGPLVAISEIRWNPAHDVLGFIVHETAFTERGPEQSSSSTP